MNKVVIGKIVNTHGIHGEIRILSDLSSSQKKEIFKVGSHLLVQGKAYTILSYRIHKQFDMIRFEEFSNINDVLFMKGLLVTFLSSVDNHFKTGFNKSS